MKGPVRNKTDFFANISVQIMGTHLLSSRNAEVALGYISPENGRSVFLNQIYARINVILDAKCINLG